MGTRGPQEDRQKKTLEELARESGCYEPEAFYFVLEGLEYTLKHIGTRRHVTGAELSEGIRDLARERFGMLARTVLETWGVNTTADFGRIVFIMVEAGVMSKTEEDDVRDFEGVYEFEQAFDGYRITGDIEGT